MYSLSVLSLLALAPISSILAAPAPAVNALEVRTNTPVPHDVVAGLMGLRNDYTLLAGWQAANSWTGPASLDVNFCECDNSSPAFEWYITIPNDNNYDSSCGAGFLTTSAAAAASSQVGAANISAPILPPLPSGFLRTLLAPSVMPRMLLPQPHTTAFPRCNAPTLSQRAVTLDRICLLVAIAATILMSD